MSQTPQGEILTLSLFCRTSFLVGILPYRRNNRCSSGLRDWFW